MLFRMSCARTSVSLLPQSSSPFPKTSLPRQLRLYPTAVLRPSFSVRKLPPPSASSSSISGAATPLKHTVFPSGEEEGVKRKEFLLEKTVGKLQRGTGVEKLKLIDDIQRLGIGHLFDDTIAAVLRLESSAFSNQEDLFTTALRFRLLRHAGFHVSPEVFVQFKDKIGKFKESETLGLLSLYEAANMGAKGEEILEEAMEFALPRLRRSLAEVAPPLHGEVAQALEVPRHMRMARLEARRFIEHYGKQRDHDADILELAILDYNQVQSQHQLELTEITRWWKQLGLVDKLGFGRDRPLECFLWTVGLLPEPKYSTWRIEMAKAISILLVIDDVFDTYGKMDELILFTHAIRRWDLEAMESLPEYMKICYMALYNTTNEICYKVLKSNGLIALQYLKSTWIDVIECMMVEARWFNGGGSPPNLEEYIENGVSTAGAYMALIHLFFLIGDGVNGQNAQLLSQKPYPKLFSAAGRILRLWDDLGTAKEEEERGDLASSIHLFMREKNLSTVEDVRSRISEEISCLWKDLNAELISNNLPLPIIKVALNMARASQVVYNHEHDTYFSSVDNYVEALFFTPLISS